MSLNRTYFTSSGSWTVPYGVTTAILVGCGGGGGAGGGSGSGSGPNGGGPQGGAGGGSAIQSSSVVSVTPQQVIDITIGSGGVGGVGGASSGSGAAGVPGGDTSFDDLTVFFRSFRG